MSHSSGRYTHSASERVVHLLYSSLVECTQINIFLSALSEVLSLQEILLLSEFRACLKVKRTTANLVLSIRGILASQKYFPFFSASIDLTVFHFTTETVN